MILSFTNTKYYIPFICNTVDLDYFMVVWSHKLKTNPNLNNTGFITIKTVKLRQIYTCELNCHNTINIRNNEKSEFRSYCNTYSIKKHKHFKQANLGTS